MSDLQDTQVEPQIIKDEPEEVFVKPASKPRKSKKDSSSPIGVSDQSVSIKKDKKKEKQKDLRDSVLLFVKANDKCLKKQSKVMKDVLSEYSKQLSDPNIIKSYLLPAFHFCESHQLTITEVAEFSRVYVKISECTEKLEKLHSLPEDLALDSAVLEKLGDAYGKKYWKVPQHDFDRIHALLQQQDTVTATLSSIRVTKIQDKLGDKGEITCLTPVVYYQ